MLQHLVDGVGVEEPTVDGGRVDPFRQPVIVRVVTPVEALPLRLLFLAERVVVDALAWEPEIHLLNLRWHEIAVRHRGRELVRVGGHPRLQVEELVGVPVDLIPRRRGQAHQEGIEVPKDGPVLLVHRTVRLVDDHEVEMPDAAFLDTLLGEEVQANCPSLSLLLERKLRSALLGMLGA